jgi:hypothetical protein
MATGSRAGLARAAAAGRRAWPVLLMAYERWQSLSPAEKERYRRQAREYAHRGRAALENARRRNPGR